MTAPNGIHYEMQGDGDTALLFLHYFGSSGGTWQSMMAHLSARYRCIAPDLRGFGASDISMEMLGVEDHADDMQLLIKSLGLKKYMLIGHSMGGKIAMALAARCLPGLESIVLLAPSPPTSEPMRDEDRNNLRKMYGDAEMIGAHLKKICARQLPATVIQSEANIQLRAGKLAWQAWLNKGSREDISSMMASINVPALIIGGALDPGITPALLTKEVAGRIARSKLSILPDAGHLLHLECEAAIVFAIQEWNAC